MFGECFPLSRGGGLDGASFWLFDFQNLLLKFGVSIKCTNYFLVLIWSVLSISESHAVREIFRQRVWCLHGVVRTRSIERKSIFIHLFCDLLVQIQNVLFVVKVVKVEKVKFVLLQLSFVGFFYVFVPGGHNYGSPDMCLVQLCKSRRGPRAYFWCLCVRTR